MKGDGRKEEVCKFFTTDQGCRKGKGCKWAHVMDDQKRCWNCGAKDHFATSCPRREGAERMKEGERGSPDGKGYGGKGGSTTVRSMKKEEEAIGGGKDGGDQARKLFQPSEQRGVVRRKERSYERTP